MAHDYVNRSRDEQPTRINLAHSNKQVAEPKHPKQVLIL